MGLFDEIQKHIREAVDEAKRATGEAPAKPQRQPPPQPVQDTRPEEPSSYANPFREPPPPAAMPEVRRSQSTAPVQNPEIEQAIIQEQHEIERLEQHRQELNQLRDKLDNTKETITLVHKLLDNRNGLAAAIITQEILGPPKALRDDEY